MKTYRHPLILVLTVLAVLALVLLLRPRRLSSVLPDGESEITFCKVLLLSRFPRDRGADLFSRAGSSFGRSASPDLGPLGLPLGRRLPRL